VTRKFCLAEFRRWSGLTGQEIAFRPDRDIAALEPNTLAEMSMSKSRLIVAITGASGIIYGIRALELLRAAGSVETHVILSPAALRTATEETDLSADQIKALADKLYNYRDIGAAISSGSFQTIGMLIAPCSVKTLSAIAHCYNDELIARAADVCLKERRRVVAMFRETPLHAGHIALMDQATRNGAVLMPPVPAFYNRPRTIDDIVTQSVGRALDLFGIHLPIVRRWKDEAGETATGSKDSDA
jgi:4-hydroxy-3-polyprenylbenzoate decarboxylase